MPFNKTRKNKDIGLASVGYQVLHFEVHIRFEMTNTHSRENLMYVAGSMSVEKVLDLR